MSKMSNIYTESLKGFVLSMLDDLGIKQYTQAEFKAFIAQKAVNIVSDRFDGGQYHIDEVFKVSRIDFHTMAKFLMLNPHFKNGDLNTSSSNQALFDVSMIIDELEEKDDVSLIDFDGELFFCYVPENSENVPFDECAFYILNY